MLSIPLFIGEKINWSACSLDQRGETDPLQSGGLNARAVTRGLEVNGLSMGAV